MTSSLWEHLGLIIKEQNIRDTIVLQHQTGIPITLRYNKTTSKYSWVQIRVSLAWDFDLTIQTLDDGPRHTVMNRAFEEHLVKWYAILLGRFESSNLWDPVIEKCSLNPALIITKFTWSKWGLRVQQSGEDNGVQVNLSYKLPAQPRLFENLRAFKNLLGTI